MSLPRIRRRDCRPVPFPLPHVGGKATNVFDPGFFSPDNKAGRCYVQPLFYFNRIPAGTCSSICFVILDSHRFYYVGLRQGLYSAGCRGFSDCDEFVGRISFRQIFRGQELERRHFSRFGQGHNHGVTLFALSSEGFTNPGGPFGFARRAWVGSWIRCGFWDRLGSGPAGSAFWLKRMGKLNHRATTTARAKIAEVATVNFWSLVNSSPVPRSSL